jgi:poly-gamma-glutamate system protein
MNSIRAKSNIVLSILAILSLLALIAVENSKVDVKQDWYAEKLQAAKLAKQAADTIREYRMKNGVFVDEVNDPNQTALIGQEYTQITTDRGYIEAKLSSTNPNFAAIIVQLLKDAGVEKGDNVAVAMTGSFPGLNIATLAALETLQAHPIIITSVGSSNWGANDPYFTWLDMETLLNESGVFHTKSIAASTGGGADIGRGLSPLGRELIAEAIKRNDVPFIHEKHLEKSIALRMNIYKNLSKEKPVKAFINIGGGIASLGNTINGKIIPSGLTMFLPEGNFPVRGVMIRMGQNKVPIIHLLNINQLLTKYGLPKNPVPLPDPGTGEIFIHKKYNVIVTATATIILVITIILVYIAERKHHRLGTEIVPLRQTGKGDKDDADDIPVI